MRHPPQEWIQPIKPLELDLLFQGVVPEGIVKYNLLRFGLFDDLVLVRTASTVRAKKYYHDGVLVLDKTTSDIKTTFQAEFRSDNIVPIKELDSIKEDLGVLNNCLSVPKVERIWVQV